MLQDLAVRARNGVVQLPARQQLAHLLAQRSVGQGPHRLVSELGMLGQLGEHSHQPVRNRLTAGIGRRLDDFDDRLDGHTIRGVQDELAPLCRIATHLDEPAQRLRSHRPNQLSRPSAEHGGFRG